MLWEFEDDSGSPLSLAQAVVLVKDFIILEKRTQTKSILQQNTSILNSSVLHGSQMVSALRENSALFSNQSQIKNVVPGRGFINWVDRVVGSQGRSK